MTHPNVKTFTPVHRRFMRRSELQSVLAIEEAVHYPYQLGEEDFLNVLKQRNIVPMVAEHNERVVAFFLYQLCKHHLELLNLGVHPDWQGQGIGRQCLEKVVEKLSSMRRNRVVCHVRESNLGGQKFLRACGWRAVGIVDRYFDNTEAAYKFVYRRVEE